MRSREWVMVAAALGALAGCDEQAPAADEVHAITGMAVAGACRASDDLGRINLSVLLFDEGRSIRPGDQLAGGAAADVVRADAFGFVRAPADAAGPEAVVATGDDGMPRGVGLAPASAAYEWVGGPARVDEQRLVVMLLDHSGSLVGVDPFTGAFDATRASDSDDQRITFFSELAGRFDAETAMSLVWFNGDAAHIAPEYATPTANGDVIGEGLRALQYEEQGETPLTLALNETRARVIAPNADLNPVVILFTDGIEGGDPSDEGGGFEAALEGYGGQGDQAAIPVIVLHIQPPLGVPSEQRGRSARLAELACRTGGQYIFLPDNLGLTQDAALLETVAARVVGAWRLGVETGLDDPGFAPGGWLLSTRLEATLDGRSLGVDLQSERRDDGRVIDSRMWFEKL